jgi:hypothetical protein
VAGNDIELASTLSEDEQAQRRRFVQEYLVDYDPLGAAIRIGFAKGYAAQYAAQFMEEPFVRKLIAEDGASLGILADPISHKQKILAGLYREANSKFNSGAARVAAFTQISKITGNDAPIKTEQAVTVTAKGPDTSHLSIEDLEEIKRKMFGAPDAAPK